MQYSPKYDIVRRLGFDFGDNFNINLKSTNEQEFVIFIRNMFGLELKTNLNISTTRNNTTVDAIFTSHIDDLTTMNYMSYFSNYKSLLNVSDVK